MQWVCLFIVIFNPFTANFVLEAFRLISFVCRRMGLVFRLKAFCNKNGIVFRAHRPFWCFGNFQDEECEFSLSTSQNHYAVKLCGVKTKVYFVKLTEENTYSIDRNHEEFLRRIGRLPRELVWKQHPEYKFHLKGDPADCKRVLLFYPAPFETTLAKSHSHEIKELKDGDPVCQDMIFHTIPGLKRQLKDEMKNGR